LGGCQQKSDGDTDDESDGKSPTTLPLRPFHEGEKDDGKERVEGDLPVPRHQQHRQR